MYTSRLGRTLHDSFYVEWCPTAKCWGYIWDYNGSEDSSRGLLGCDAI